jgi:hypothetical protein
MSRPTAAPELDYKLSDDADERALNDAFNFLFDRFFNQKGETV